MKGRGRGCRSGESTRLPPMQPGFDSRTPHHGSRLRSEGFSPGPPVFPPNSKTNISKFQFDLGWSPRATGLSDEDCLVSPTLDKVN